MRIILILILALTALADDYSNNDKIQVDSTYNTVNKIVNNSYVIEKQIDTIYIRVTDTVMVYVEGNVVERSKPKKLTPRQLGYVTDW